MELAAIEFEEKHRHDEARTLVPINERVILHQSKSIARRKVEKVRFAIRPHVLRLAHRGIEQALVPDTRGAAVFCERLLMEHEHRLPQYPFGLVHFASSRSVWR